jgi:hypothetical protein
MYSFNGNGVSSSLSLPSVKSFWNTGRESDGILHVVTSITLRQILHSMPNSVKRIPYLKTDIQGYDWSVINDTGADLRNFPVDYLYTEVYFEEVATYKNIQNDFCRDWMPMMGKLGYELIYVDTPEKTGMIPKAAIEMCNSLRNHKSQFVELREGNALWKRVESSTEHFQFQTLKS